MTPFRSFRTGVSKHHQRNLHTWSCESSKWWVRQFHTAICRSEIHHVTFRELCDL